MMMIVETQDGLDALPDGTVVRTADGETFQKDSSSGWDDRVWWTPGSDVPFMISSFPVEVISALLASGGGSGGVMAGSSDYPESPCSTCGRHRSRIVASKHSAIRGRLRQAESDMDTWLGDRLHRRGQGYLQYDLAAMRYAAALREATEAGIL